MFKKITLANIIVGLFAVILLIPAQISFADGNSYTVNVPNAQGGYTAIVIRQSGIGYVGPQGEYYARFPKVADLQVIYGVNAPSVVGKPAVPTTVYITIAPPALPFYEQPEPPAPDYIWAPGYWAHDRFFGDYYWVPGTWVRAPSAGLLWTPGYWYWREGHFVFSDGYWGIHIGFYGGINYGHGYEGRGFSGGGWHNGVFHNKRINGDANRDSSGFNGGPGGTKFRPTDEEKAFMKEKHVPATNEQKKHVQGARQNPSLRASANHGKPVIAATSKPGVFKGKGVVAAKQAGAFYNKTRAVNPKRAAASHGLAPKPAAKKLIVKKPQPHAPAADEEKRRTKDSQVPNL